METYTQFEMCEKRFPDIEIKGEGADYFSLCRVFILKKLIETNIFPANTMFWA